MGVFSKKITLKNRRSWGRLVYSLTSPLAWGGGRVGVVKPCNVQKRGPGLRENGCLWGPPQREEVAPQQALWRTQLSVSQAVEPARCGRPHHCVTANTLSKLLPSCWGKQRHCFQRP